MTLSSSRPASVTSRPSAPAANGGGGRTDDEICIVAEKEGRGGGGRTSANSDHSIHRINGLEDRPLSRQSIIHPGHRNSPAGNGPHKADSPAVKAPLPPSSLPGGYYPRSHLLPPASDPFGRGYGLPAHHHQMSAALQDPRTMSMLSYHMAAGARPPPSPFEMMDPFRDPYRLDLFRDPVREARERELLRLGELDRAKVMSLAAGYQLPPGYYPPTTLTHKMVPPHLSMAYGGGAVPPSLGLPPLGLGHPLGLNGAPGGPGAPQYGKDPLRR